MRLAIQGRAFAAALAIIATALLSSKIAGGEEPCERCELRFEVKATGVPWLDRIPYVSRLFKNSAAEPGCGEDFERIGVDFEAVPGRVFEIEGLSGVCPACFKCSEDSKCCSEGKCCAAECQVAKGEPSELWEHLAELTAENAAMEATLEAHEALLDAKEKMFETLAGVLVEKAKLEAKLEMVEHRDAMLKEMVELHAENAKLKAQAELAQQKEELLQGQLATVLENERLKQRVAELEQRAGDGEQPVLTAKKAQKPKKAR